MKVLFTGMSSSHCKPGRNQSFFRTLASAYEEFSKVTWSEPKLSWTKSDLDQFDQIIFGFSPPTSMGANYLYGAVNVLNIMYESPKLRLVVDSPQMWQYKNSLRAFKRDSDQIFGSFYSSRKNYAEAKKSNVRESAEALAYKLANAQWPISFAPSLPWQDKDSISSKLPFISEGSVVTLNLDSLLLTKETPSIGRSEQWAVDNPKSAWFLTTKNTLRFPTMSMKNSTKPKDPEVRERINSCMGAIIAPQDRNLGTWWSYRYVQAMNTTTPIATYWQESGSISPEWGLLGYQIEDMQPYERQHVAFQQIKQYESLIPNKESAINKLQNLVIDSYSRG